MKPRFRHITGIQTVGSIDFNNPLDYSIEVSIILKSGFHGLAHPLQPARNFRVESAFPIGVGGKLPLAVCVKELNDSRTIGLELFMSIHKAVRIEMAVDAGITPVNRKTADQHWI